MRQLLALVILFCGAASADAAESRNWCSDGFDQPAVIDEAAMVVTIGGKSDAIDTGTAEVPMGLQHGDLVLYDAHDQTPQDKQQIIIFRDRLFWPCGAASAAAADTEATVWCEGDDRLAVDEGHFHFNGKRLQDNTVTDQTEETGVFFEYDGRLFSPCAKP